MPRRDDSIIKEKPMRGREMKTTIVPSNMFESMRAVSAKKTLVGEDIAPELEKPQDDTVHLYHEGYVDDKLYLVPDENLQNMKDDVQTQIQTRGLRNLNGQRDSFKLDHHNLANQRLTALMNKTHVLGSDSVRGSTPRASTGNEEDKEKETSGIADRDKVRWIDNKEEKNKDKKEDECKIKEEDQEKEDEEEEGKVEDKTEDYTNKEEGKNKNKILEDDKSKEEEEGINKDKKELDDKIQEDKEGNENYKKDEDDKNQRDKETQDIKVKDIEEEVKGEREKPNEVIATAKQKVSEEKEKPLSEEESDHPEKLSSFTKLRLLISGHFRKDKKPNYIIQEYREEKDLFKDHKADFHSRRKLTEGGIDAVISGRFYNEAILEESYGKPVALNIGSDKIIIDEKRSHVYDDYFKQVYNLGSIDVLLTGEFLKSEITKRITPFLSLSVTNSDPSTNKNKINNEYGNRNKNGENKSATTVFTCKLQPTVPFPLNS